MRLFTPECKQIYALWYNMDVGSKWQLPEYTVSRVTKRFSVHRNLKALSYNFTFTLKYPRKQWWECPCKEMSRTGLLTKGALHLSLRTDQPDHSRRKKNFLFNQNTPARSVKSYIVCTKELVFQQNSWRKPISFSNWLVRQWSGRPVLTNGKRPNKNVQVQLALSNVTVLLE